MSVNSDKIPVLSFFSGGGFLDMGFEMANFPIVWTNENDVQFAKMHAYGITEWRKSRGINTKAEIFNTRSIEDISPDQIILEAFPDGKPDIFGVIGGPPCQDFSASGHNAGFEGERGKLTKVYLDYILKIKPSFFVLENVRNLWNNNQHRANLEVLLEKMKRNYFIDHKILNAIHFGVPQDRHRLFIIGFKKSYARTIFRSMTESCFMFQWPEQTHPKALTCYNWPDKNNFQGRTIKPENVPLDLCIANLLLTEEDENLIPNGKEYFQPYSEKFWSIEEGNTLNRSFKRLHRYRYSPTACYGNNEVHLHPFLPRRLSVREALRIQSVSDTYTLPEDVGLSSKFKMIGNGVPVKLSFVVAKSIRDFLNTNQKHEARQEVIANELTE